MNRRERRRAGATSAAIQQRVAQPEAARHFRDAVEHLKNGRLTESETAHRRVLKQMPSHAPSLHHLGLIAYKRRDLADSVHYIRQSLAIKPDYHEAWLNLAIILGEMRRSKEAIEACRQCLALQPKNSETHNVLGNLLRVVENDAEAMAAYIKALELKPDQPAVLVQLAELMLKSGQNEAAAARCRRALELDPENEEAKALARRVATLSRSVDAIVSELEAQTASRAELAKRLDDLGTQLRADRRYGEAAELCRRAIEVDPGNADYHFNLALGLEGLGHLDEALRSYQAGLAIEPERAQGYASVGNLLRTMSMANGAIQAFEHAVKLDPELASAYYDLAVLLKQLEQHEKARVAFEKCLEIAPDSTINRFEFLNLRRILCDWLTIDEEEYHCLQSFRDKPVRLAPFQLISLWSSRDDQLKAARGFVKTFDVPQSARFTSHRSLLGVGRRIRLGFLSSDYFEHATAMLFAEVLEKLDRSRFEIFGYCYSREDGSEMRQRMLRAFEHVRKLGPMTNRDVARMIHDDAIDVLIDLKGYTKDARTEILAYRPAPVQVNYLGYPGTMGADFIDYILSDAVVTPMEHQPDYPERIVHVPNSYQPNDRQRKISDEPVTRAEHGLPENGFVFCSFNNSYKLNPTMFDVWMYLLRKVEGSVLWLLVPNDICADNLRKEASVRGVDPDRLVFAKRTSVPKHLARHRLADLFLDALPCNAHTTTSDALWTGLPVLTCLGETFSGRVAGSLLTAMGVPELITTDLDAYTDLALELARDRSKLDRVRQKVADQRDTAALFDSTRYTRNLEKSFEMMVEIARSGDGPRPFVVVEDTHAAASSSAAVAAVAPAASAAEAEAPSRPPVLREIYDACPLCESRDIAPETEARITNHQLYKSILPAVLKWCRCASCDHVFTEGYLTAEGRDVINPAANAEQKVGKDAENQRKASAKIVARVARHVSAGEWLDIGFGNASLLFTAAEWGFSPVGIDRDDEGVQRLRKFGYEAHRILEALDAKDRFSVISMVDCLDRTPFPGKMLDTANKMMRAGGVLFISTLNMDSIVWRALDATGANPYWAELEHCHNFTRARLVSLLQSHGFEFAEYDIGERHRSSMEIIAVKR